MRILIVGILVFVPHVTLASVYISEVAWMGDNASHANEWIEIFSTEEVSVEGWKIVAEDGTPEIELSGVVSGAVVLSRGVEYTGALENGGEVLVLLDGDGTELDRVDAEGGWMVGDNDTKETMQKVGGVWETGAPTPGSVAAEEEEESVESVAVEAPGGAYNPPQLVVEVPEEMEVVAGDDAEFSVYVGNTDGVEYMGAQVLWNFGDGSVGSGQRVYHRYVHPGTYVAHVEVSYARDRVAKRIVVSVREAGVVFSFVDRDTVRIENTDEVELNLSRWRIVSGSSVFIFPEHTYVLPGETLALSSAVTGFYFTENTTLTYPNGEVVRTSVVKEKSEPAPQVVYVPQPTEPVVEEEEEEVSVQPAAAIVAEERVGISLWVYAWLFVVLGVAGGIVWVRRNKKALDG